MNVVELWRYPVKSMIGETVTTVDVDHLGIVDDRTWAIRDLERGGIRGAKKISELMRFSAHRDAGGGVQITAPDGTTVSAADPAVHDVLSRALGRPVRLEPLAGADDLDHFRRGAPDHDDPLTEFRAVMGRDPDEPLPDVTVFPPEIVEFESPPGTYYDAWPLMIMSTAALADLRAALPDSVVDIRRFRPSVVVDTGDATGHPEFDWTGRTASIGTAVVEFLAPCPRCVMVTHDVGPDIPADRRVLRHIVRELGQNVGVYARIVTAGSMRVGDDLSFS